MRFGGDQFEDRPASHADAHTRGERCSCHGKTEAELARPYALFVFSLPVLALVALIVAVVRA